MAFQNSFPVFKKTVIENYLRRDKQILPTRPLRARGLEFDFRFAGVSDRCVGPVERAISVRLRNPAQHQSSGKHRR